jgi:type II secretory pathway component GspD/PulD (secretin)
MVAVPSSASRNAPPPIRISRTEDGRLVVQSADQNAINLFEELADQILQQRKGFTVFTVEHQTATWIALTLEEFFVAETDDKKDNSNNDFFFFWDERRNNKDDEPAGLGSRGTLTFVADNDSKSIVVRNATESQLRTIAELIKIYDVKTPVDRELARFTRMIPLQAAKAQDVADTVKAAFQDLLSKSDAAFRKNDKENKKGDGRDEGEQQAQDSNVISSSLSGKLAIGVDEPSNLLVVSTKGEKLMEVITKTIKDLDEAAKESRNVRVVQLRSSTPKNIHQTLLNLIDPNNSNRQKAETEKSNPPPQSNNQNGNGDANGRRRNERDNNFRDREVERN